MQTLTAKILPQTIRQRPADSYKGTYGRIVLIGGNQNFGGAIIMASAAAVYAGAGLVTTLTDPSNQGSLHARLPEAMFADYHDTALLTSLVTGANVIVIGPGLGTDATALATLQRVFTLVTPQQTLVVDGSAITLVAEHQLALPAVPLVLTPHQMEWQRISGIRIADQTEAANRQMVDRLHATVVLKSHRTEIYTPTGTYENPLGTPAQATGGMGDTLAGMVGGFLAQFSNPTDAVLAAVYSHSAIAEELARTQYVVLPHQITEQLPTFMKAHEAQA
ncbi:NAD(P)H-hydrate dehydratase [Levilactobacillus acidifarinae]|uniref:ADP-dependent (S)-NAD(P)H-hydrate dehydratase n=1 Tax=Levilactobacillus acidifarinae DSM 19394 = JCM 15949 TaxID=1423715 RepID=A0A0R1LF89_9LACO|nr:NAD(P)H-hydrate dehydratase [Levilactobacillus acidifarinae]KRK94277.1 sugar kinase [Levilactobacillus acidifarinae DSM 19394]GEO69922.1 ADP-dependent (S)-NAD(P)H-hydrate dehydratase [Levilactobacillus acidifarinae]